MLIKNAKVFCDNNRFIATDVRFNDKTLAVEKQDEDGIDASGCILIPGLIDIHTHGAMGADTCDSKQSELAKMSKYYAKIGVTSFCATSMTYDELKLTQVMNSVGTFKRESGAKCEGINMEGPFINPSKKGAQAAVHITNPNYAMFKRLNDAANGRIRIVALAPELPGSMEFIRSASLECTVSLAHTAADYETALQAFENGASHVTHLFNAMDPFLHRSPGIVGAALEAKATVELICDGIHLHPAVVRIVFNLYGPDRTCLISDSMRSAGLPDGNYELGGQTVFVNEGKAVLRNGTIAGSSINLMTAVKKAITFGITPESALTAATITPARAIGMDDVIGSITPGKCADLVLLDAQWNILRVFVDGREIEG